MFTCVHYLFLVGPVSKSQKLYLSGPQRIRNVFDCVGDLNTLAARFSLSQNLNHLNLNIFCVFSKNCLGIHNFSNFARAFKKIVLTNWFMRFCCGSQFPIEECSPSRNCTKKGCMFVFPRES